MLIGAAMGFITFLMFAAIQAAGDLIDVFGGFSLAAAFDPLSQNRTPCSASSTRCSRMMLLFATAATCMVLRGCCGRIETMPLGPPGARQLAGVLTVAFSVFFARRRADRAADHRACCSWPTSGWRC